MNKREYPSGIVGRVGYVLGESGERGGEELRVRRVFEYAEVDMEQCPRDGG